MFQNAFLKVIAIWLASNQTAVLSPLNTSNTKSLSSTGGLLKGLVAIITGSGQGIG